MKMTKSDRKLVDALVESISDFRLDNRGTITREGIRGGVLMTKVILENLSTGDSTRVTSPRLYYRQFEGEVVLGLVRRYVRNGESFKMWSEKDPDDKELNSYINHHRPTQTFILDLIVELDIGDSFIEDDDRWIFEGPSPGSMTLRDRPRWSELLREVERDDRVMEKELKGKEELVGKE